MSLGWKTVAKGAITTVASGNITISLTTSDATPRAGDLMIALCAYRGTASFTAPGGWTIPTNGQTAVGDSALNGIAAAFLAYKTHSGSESAPTFTRTGGDVAHAQIVILRGGTTFTTADSAQAGAAATTVSTTGVTTVSDNSLLVTLVAFGNDGTFTSVTATSPASSGTPDSLPIVPSTWTEVTDDGTTTGANVLLGYSVAVKTATGATGTVTATGTPNARHAIVVAAFESAAIDNSELQLAGVESLYGQGTLKLATMGQEVLRSVSDSVEPPRVLLMGAEILRTIPLYPYKRIISHL